MNFVPADACTINEIMHYRWIAFVLALMLVQWPIAAKKKPHVPDSLKLIRVEVNGVTIDMQRVEGGSFVMGATEEQYDPDTYTDKPAHLVFLSPFYIATTEVTNRLWRTVMPDKETLSPEGYPMHPVSFVSWHDAQVFVHRLDSMTGYAFRLPTEAEWEYAARGGEKSKHYRFAGGRDIDSIGWTYPLAGQWTHPVARKHPNELGLYDMTGNVAEWCQDIYGAYQLSTLPDPCGADTGSYRIVRGGSYDQVKANCHLSVRRWHKPEETAGFIGLRVAFSLPNDPGAISMVTGKITEDEPRLPLTQNIRVKGKKIRFDLVSGETPYYISEEISAAYWKKIMVVSAPNEENGMATGMSREERIRFAETCSRLADKPVAVASIAETDSALAKGVIAPAKPTKKKKTEQNIQSVQRSRRTHDKLSPWAEMVGVRMTKPDDPILLQYKGDDNEKRTLRLVMRP